jgi:hypothetical protein
MKLNMNKIKKYWTLIISVGVLATIALGVSGYIALAPFGGDKTINAIKYEYDNGTIFSGDGQVNKDQFKTFVRDLNYQFVQTKFDIFKPVYSLVRAQYYPKDNLSDDKKVHNVISIYLERKGLLEWKVVDTKDSAITGLSYTDTATLASPHDRTTNFPNKEKYKITNYPPLTPQEIESNRKLREGGNTYETTFGASAYYLEQVKKNSKVFETTTSKEEKITILQDFLKLQQDTLDVLKSGKEYVYPDGSKIPSNSQTIELTQSSVTQTKSVLENTKNQATQ